MRLYASSATERGIRERGVSCFPAETISKERRRPVFRQAPAAQPPTARPDNEAVHLLATPRSEAKQIIIDIARKHGLTYADLVGTRRFRHIVPARDEAMAAVRALSNGRESFSLPMVGRIFGGKDHTTVLAALRRHAKRVAHGNLDPAAVRDRDEERRK